MNKTKFWIYIVLTFILGVAAGVVGNGMLYKQRLHRFAVGPPPPVIFLNRMTHQLDLTPEQHERIGDIINSSHEQFSKLAANFHPNVEEMMTSSFSAIRDELTDSQQDEFDTMVKQLKTRMDRFKPDKPRPDHKMAFPGDRLPPHEHLLGRMKDELQLTPEQEYQIRPLIEDFFETRHQLFEMDKTRKKMTEDKISFEVKLSSILTDKQLETFKNNIHMNPQHFK
ncbi:MAG: hypothetical protein K9L30_11415 [Desulfobacterales bacterium]|nr:hypothetical protein [Desulfobacterales bacterium]